MQHEVLRHQTMTALVRKFKVDFGLGASLFRQGVPSPTNEYTFDVLEYSRDLAKYRDPQAEAGMVNPMTKKKTSVIIPTIREKKLLSGAAMNWLRRPGTEHQQYGKQMLADELSELNQRLEQRKEWWRWQLLNGGDTNGYFTVSITDGAVTASATYDFGFSTSHKVNAGTAWSGTGSDSIIGDIISGKKLIMQDHGVMPTRAYCTETVMKYLIQNSGVKALMGDSLKDQVAQWGYLKRFLGLDIQVYEAGHVADGSSTWNSFITDDHFIIVGPGTVGDEVVAPPVDPRAGGTVGKFSKSWVEEDPAGTWILVEETCLAGLTKPEGIYIVNTV
jgi:hypothetical protein